MFFTTGRCGWWTWYHFAGTFAFLFSRTHEQILDDEAGRGDDFLLYLRRVQFEASLLADNPDYDLVLDTTHLKEKSTDLISAIIRFFNSALVYFSKDFFGNSCLIPDADLV